MAKMIRITDSTSEKLDDLVQATKQTKQKILAQAVELLSREFFLKETNRQYLLLNKEDKQDLFSEAEEWDSALLDGLEDD